jgi:hypothetical protein
VYDEGLVVLGADRILAGELPYMDFWTVYPPGQFYVLAAIFRLFGSTLLVARIFDTFVRFVIVLLSHAAARKLTTREAALLVAALVSILLAAARTYMYPVFPAFGLGLLALLTSFRYLQHQQLGSLFLSGLLIGLSTLFRWDIGLYAGVAVLLSLVLWVIWLSSRRSARDNNWGLTLAKPPLAFLAGTVLVALPFYGVLSLQVGFREMWSQLVEFPVTTLGEVRRQPIPPFVPAILSRGLSLSKFKAHYPAFLDWLLFYIPAGIYLAAVISLLTRLLKKGVVDVNRENQITSLVVFGALSFAQALNRYDYIHVLPSSLVALLVGVPLLQGFLSRLRRRVARAALLLLAVAGGVQFLLTPVFILISTLYVHTPLGCYTQVERAGCIALDEDQELTLAFLDEETAPGELIFVGNQTHARIFINDIGFYFLADRPSATKYHELHPGWATTELVQAKIVAEIERNQVRWIVLWDDPLTSGLERQPDNGTYLLDEYIRSNYASVKTFGKYQVWQWQGR